ncbi:MAG TPA: 2OG-Fe(II) oxygenase [Pyrinomonadaceae bacterium]
MTTRTPALPGIHTVEEFFDRQTCELIKDEMRAGQHERARVFDRDWENREDAGYRSTLRVKVGEGVNALVTGRLLDVRETLGRHFDVALSDCQPPTYLIYKPGDFFEAHKDDSRKPEAPEFIRGRQVSAVVFLSDEDAGDGRGEYAGGSLGFYGLLKDPRCAHIGIPVKGRAGLLVAFRSDVFHQVTPVTRGERFTIVSWYV